MSQRVLLVSKERAGLDAVCEFELFNILVKNFTDAGTQVHVLSDWSRSVTIQRNNKKFRSWKECESGRWGSGEHCGFEPPGSMLTFMVMRHDRF
jgi:hypothetical protein